MPKRIILLCLFSFGLLTIGTAQDSLLLELNQHRIKLNKTNMWVLGGWAAGNILVSGIMRGQTSGTQKYFHEMNAVWNLVNLGIAGGALYGAYTSDPTGLDLWATFREQQKIEKVLLFNLALNFTYITGGAYLIEKSKNATSNPERLKGYGQSLLLQGGFLLLFDATQFFLHHNHATPKLEQLLSHVQVGGNGLSLVIAF